MKRRSPSRGEIRPDFDPVGCAKAYADAGAAAISVLTDGPGFGGSLADLAAVRAAVDVPLLRKDFVLDRYQLLEARAHGADAALLVVAALAPDALRRLVDACAELGLAALVEVHDPPEVDVALGGGARIVGVNNRDLRTFRVFDTATQCRAAVVSGLMVLPPYFDDPEDARPYFRRLRELRDGLLRRGLPASMLRHLSMGMSHDLDVAVEEGATMVRVGTAIFGAREGA